MLAMAVVGIVFSIILLIVLFRVLKSVVSFAISFFGIVVVVFLVISAMKYADKKDLRNNLLISNNLVLVEDDGNILSGFATLDKDFIIDKDDEIDYLDESLQSSFYKVIIVQKDELGSMSLEDYYEGLISNDFVNTLISKERSGSISVYHKTIAFRHGLELVRT